MASDCLHSIERFQISTDVPETQLLEWHVTLLTSIAEVLPDANCIARASSFWLDSVADPALKKELAKCGVSDFEAAFTQHFGIALSELFIALVTIYKYLTARVKSRPIQPFAMTVEDDWWGAIDPANRMRVLELLSIKAADFPGCLFGAPRQSWATDFSFLMAHPFIESQRGRFICPDIGCLRTFFTDGVFWLLSQAFANAEWGNAFGIIYEWYIRRLFLSASGQRPATKQLFFDKVTFQGSTDQVCDLLMVDQEHAALVEVKGTRLTTRQKSGISVDDTMVAIRKSVASSKSGVGQLAKNVARILRGDVVVSGGNVVEVASKKMLIPVLVWYEEAADNAATRHFLNEVFVEQLSSEGGDLSRMGPLVLLSTHDVEMFEQCSEYLAPNVLLERYVAFIYANRDNLNCTFLRYVYSTFQGREQPKGWIGKKIEEVIQRTMAMHAKRSQGKSETA